MQKYTHPQQYWIKDKISNLSSNDRLSYIDLLINLTSLNINEEVKGVINEVLSDCKIIESILKPLNKHGIFFDLWLSGEAVSDLMLGHHKKIKKLKFLIKFKPFMDLFIENGLNENFSTFYKDLIIDEKLKNNFNIKNWIIPFEDSITHDARTKLNLMKRIDLELLSMILSSNDFIYNSDFILQDDLIGSITLNDNRLKYLTEINVLNIEIDEFIKTYSFDIHKVSVELINSFLSIEDHDFDIVNVNDFIKRLKFEIGFLNDVMNKNISINITDLSLKQISHICEEKYNHLKVKYDPNHWKVRFSDINVENDQHEDFLINEEDKDNVVYIKHFLRKHELELIVKEKEPQEEKIKKI